MILSSYAKQVEKFAADNSPAILTGIAVVGTVATAWLTGKATFKAATLIEEDRLERTMMNKPGPERKDEFKLVWKEYIPPVSTVVLTIGCIICANRIDSRRAAAMVAAYSIKDKAFQEYKEKVTEKLGLNKEQAVRDEVAQDAVNQNPPRDREVIITGSGEVLFYDQPSKRYFKNNVESIRSIQNDVNLEVVHNGWSTLGDLYARLGIGGTPFSEELGWTTDDILDIKFSTTLTGENQPCIVIDYNIVPIRGYK